jgi:hypothetical protein
MKKLILVLIIGLLLGTAAFADHEGFGIGIVGGGGWSGVGAGYPGLSLKIPSIPIFWGFYIPIIRDGFSTGITADYYIFDSNLVSTEFTNEDGIYKFKLDWYFGVGFFFNMYSWPDDFNLDLGLRLPIGLSWHIIRQIELFFGVNPGIGFWIGDYERHYMLSLVHFSIGGEIGLRFWFSK